MVRDSRQSASGRALEPQAAQRCQELQLPDALPMAVFRRLAQDAEFPQPVAVPEPQSELKLVSKVQPQVAQLEPQDESALLWQAHSEKVSR